MAPGFEQNEARLFKDIQSMCGNDERNLLDAYAGLDDTRMWSALSKRCGSTEELMQFAVRSVLLNSSDKLRLESDCQALSADLKNPMSTVHILLTNRYKQDKMALRKLKLEFRQNSWDWHLKTAAEWAIFANGGPPHLQAFCSELLT